MIELETTVRMRCNVCKSTYLCLAVLEGSVPKRPNNADESYLAFLEVTNAIAELRHQAQDAGWTYILPVGRRDADLCPTCYVIEPEE